MGPEHATAGTLAAHGASPPLAEEQIAVVAGLGNRTGPEGELLCVSCHRVHGAQSGTALLSFQPQYGEVCVACHAEQAGVFGTSHDLRAEFPRLANAAGLTPAAAGTCSACHMAHEFPRPAVPGPGDPSGRCTSCHQPGQPGAAHPVDALVHPETACTQCHDPHRREFGRFLHQPEAELCASCHPGTTRLLGGPHDVTHSGAADEWPAAARESGGPCLSCHVPHGRGPELFRAVGGGDGMPDHDQVCLTCHADAAWGAATDIAAIHPQQIAPDQQKVNLALVPTDAQGSHRVGCRTCHDPHGGAEPVHLARVEPETPTESLCLHCHEQKQYIRFTGHAPAKLAGYGYDTDSCKPCHAMHASPADAFGSALSPRFLMKYCEDAPDQGTGCIPCLACHHENGPAPMRAVAVHPEVITLNIIDRASPAYMPLFNAAGKEDDQGQIVCRTCHVAHGRLDLLRYFAEKQALSPEQQQASRAQVRSFVSPNICTSCHGAEARNKFLFFHDPARRGGGNGISGP